MVEKGCRKKKKRSTEKENNSGERRLKIQYENWRGEKYRRKELEKRNNIIGGKEW